MKKILLITLSLLAITMPGVLPLTPAKAVDSAVCEGIGATSAGSGCAQPAGQKTIPEIAALIIDIFSWIVGVAAVIFIIYAGFRYVTSGGDSNQIKGAKDTMLYAMIGLVVVALAQIIVNFVLKAAING